MGKAYGYSIYFLLALVFTIMGIIAFVVVRTIVREERQRAVREQALLRGNAGGAGPGR